MHKFFREFAFVAIPVVATLIMVNYVGDAGHLFNNNYESKMAGLLQEGRMVTNVTNFEERLLRRTQINQKTDRPGLLVLGSSRVGLIGHEMFPHRPLYNGFVSGASIEDLIAVYQLIKDQGLLPDTVLLGLDPWTFNPNDKQERWKAIDKEYYAFHKKENTAAGTGKLAQLVSFSYFQKSLLNLPRVLAGADNPMATESTDNKLKTILPDGSMIYDRETREATTREVQSKVSNYLKGDIYSIENFDSISEINWQDFDHLIQDMHDQSIFVQLVLFSYHPTVYQKIKQSYPSVSLVEQLLNEYARAHDIELFGSFDPGKVGLTSEMFYDGMHVKEEGVRLTLQGF